MADPPSVHHQVYARGVSPGLPLTCNEYGGHAGQPRLRRRGRRGRSTRPREGQAPLGGAASLGSSRPRLERVFLVVSPVAVHRCDTRHAPD